MNNEILIYGEIENFAPVDVVAQLITVAQKLKDKLENSSVSVLILGDFDCKYDDFKLFFSKYGADKLLLVDKKELAQYCTKYFSYCVNEIVQIVKPSIFLIGATSQGRDLAPVVSTTLHTGLTADCTELDINEKGQLAATRPTFGGNLMATILCKNYPQMATVRPNVFKKSEVSPVKEIMVEKIVVDLCCVEDCVECLAVENFDNIDDNNLVNAEIIVAGGRGMGTKENFNLLYKLAKLLNGSVAATRVAVELGYAPSQIQIGQTGKTVNPKIYIACGISGAIQHAVGMNSSDKIIAINKDVKAPICEIADYTIIGDVNDILPLWIEKLEKKVC